jgi:mRNA interferase HigB
LQSCSQIGNRLYCLGLHVIAQSTLIAFWKNHPDAEGSLRAWHAEAEVSEWKKPDDIRRRYSSASFIDGNRVVFNIKGNTYRLVVDVRWDWGKVFIVWIGKHNDYDKLTIAEL